MNIKSGEKDFSSDDEENKSFLKKLYEVFIANWPAFFFALVITIITVVAVPIIYSIKKASDQGSNKILSWSSNATTITSSGVNLIWNGTNMTTNGTNMTVNVTNIHKLGSVPSIVLDSSDVLYIVDQTNNRIVKVIDSQGNLTIVAGQTNGSAGSDDYSLNSPMDVYVDTDMTIYIADTNNNRIEQWTQSFSAGGTKIPITGLSKPKSLTMDPISKTLYIADYGNNQIVQYNMSTNSMKIYLTQSSSSDRSSYVSTPISVNFDLTTKTVIIAQESGFNIVRWTPGSMNWQLVSGSASSELSGTSRTLFNKLCNCYVDSLGNIYVADCNNQRIQYFRTGNDVGRTLDNIVIAQGKTIAGVISANGTNPFLFNQPTSIALDKAFNLYVADSNNFRIQLFKQL